MKAKRFVRMAALIVVLAALLGACAGSDDAGNGDGAAQPSEGAEPEGRKALDNMGGVDAEETADDGAGGGFTGAADLPGMAPAVIKNALLDIEVARDGLQEAVDDAIAAAQNAGGFVLTTRLDDERSGRGTIVLRVPAERFETVLATLDDLGDVRGRSVTGEDVSEEFVDLEARLRNFEAQETVLLRLMDRARSVSDTIKVQRELTGIQLEVERIRGRLRFLEDQTSLGTVTVKLTEPGAVVAAGSTLEKAWERAGGVALAFLSGLVVSLGVVVPAAILLAFAFLAFKFVRPRFTSAS